MLVDYLYIDRPRLTSYAEQIGATITAVKLPETTAELGMAGPKIARRKAATPRPANDHELIESVTRHLGKDRLLQKARPTSPADAAVFVLETMQARKVIFEVPENSGPRGLRELVVWVSNPLEKPSSRPSGQTDEPLGMFVYLLQGHWDDGPATNAYSMMTALNVLLDTLRASGAKEIPGRFFDTSRDDYATPVDILVRNGGVKGDMRTITALYRVRSFSDNKVVNVGGRTLRCHDLFGYPLFISTDR